MQIQKRFLFIICTIICAGYSVAYGSTSIACVGNSITAGNKLSDTATQRYTSLLLKKLNTKYLSQAIVNLDTPVTLLNKGI